MKDKQSKGKQSYQLQRQVNCRPMHSSTINTTASSPNNHCFHKTLIHSYHPQTPTHHYQATTLAPKTLHPPPPETWCNRDAHVYVGMMMKSAHWQLYYVVQAVKILRLWGGRAAICCPQDTMYVVLDSLICHSAQHCPLQHLA